MSSLLAVMRGYHEMPGSPRVPRPKKITVSVYAGELAKERAKEEGGFFLRLDNGTFENGQTSHIFFASDLTEKKVLTICVEPGTSSLVIKAAFLSKAIYNPANYTEAELEDIHVHPLDLSSSMPLEVCFGCSTFEEIRSVAFNRNT